jgi:hypothetical protein
MVVDAGDLPDILVRGTLDDAQIKSEERVDVVLEQFELLRRAHKPQINADKPVHLARARIPFSGRVNHAACACRIARTIRPADGAPDTHPQSSVYTRHELASDRTASFASQLTSFPFTKTLGEP